LNRIVREKDTGRKSELKIMGNNEEDKKQKQEYIPENKENLSDRIRYDESYDIELDDFTRSSDTRISRGSRNKRNTRKSTENSTLFKSVPWLVIVLSLLGFIVIMFAFFMEERNKKEASAPVIEDPPARSAVQAELDGLSWIEQDFLPINRFSRPGTLLEAVDGIVIHNIGNPNTTAEQNRNYFANVVPAEGIFASSHFIICMDGRILQCVPIDEIAYASNARNVDTLSIEVCHPDETGRFTEESYASAIRLTAWLSVRFGLSAGDVIRHFDVERESAPKECPRYFVENEDAWERFREDVQRAIDRG